MLLRTGSRLPYTLGWYIFHFKTRLECIDKLSGILLLNLLPLADIDLDQMEYAALMSVYVEDHTFITNLQKECR